MSLYMYQASYTPESISAQIRDPKDRLDAMKPVTDAIGVKVLASGYPFGEYNLVVVFEAPDDTAVAALALAVAAGGAEKSAKTTKLLTGAEWVEALRRAQSVAPQYRPPD
jgi:uncharacterized protein with GYD domain